MQRVKDDQLLKECNKIRDKVNKSIKKGFGSKPVYNEKKISENKTKVLYRHYQYKFFMIVKCTNKILIVFVDQQYSSNNANTLSKETKK